MGTPVNDKFDPVAFVMGEEKAIDQQLTAEQSWQLLRKVIALMKPQWQELPFAGGYKHQTQQLSLWTLPDELLEIRFMAVYGGQQYRRGEEWGYVTYCITPGRKWFRVFDASANGSDMYRHHQWLTPENMMEVMVEDPSLLRYLISGLKRRAELSASNLRNRAGKLDELGAKLNSRLSLFDSLGQPVARDLPSSTPRHPM